MGLEGDGFDVDVCSNGLDAMNVIQRHAPDLIVLDVMLPFVDGLELCRRLRASTRTAFTPILMLSAKDDVEDRVSGLEMGADDYLSKPFAYRELRARVRALLRRKEQDGGNSVLSCEGVVLDQDTREASRDGQPLQLTSREFDLLALLLLNAGRVLPRRTIMERVWGYNFETESNVIDVCLHSLRKKLGLPNVIHSVRRAGFVFRR
ncbi:MAG: response regulator transcription factor [Chloroflexi bacterium]|nr:response regulator transcription factor [Chloroflexota bacterium]